MEEPEIIRIMKNSIINGCWAGFSNIYCFIHFYPSCPSTQLYFDRQKQLKSLFWNLVHLLLPSSFSASLAIQSVINTHSVVALSWPQQSQRKRIRIAGKQGALSWSVKDFALGLKGPRGCLCFPVLESLCSSDLNVSTCVQTLIRAKINREEKVWPSVKGGSIMRC